jgi:predicted flap endonuclease-1-like 5' DNA nuclease
MKIEDVEGIGPAFAAKLVAIGVKTTDDFLMACGSAAGREKIAGLTGISGKLLLEWANHVDLMRINGVGSEYADLLEAAGVDSCAELAQRNAKNLAQTFQDLDAARNTVRNIPAEGVIQGWIDQAKSLDKVVSH